MANMSQLCALVLICTTAFDDAKINNEGAEAFEPSSSANKKQFRTAAQRNIILEYNENAIEIEGAEEAMSHYLQAVKTMVRFEVNKLYYQAAAVVKDMTLEKMNKRKTVGIFKIEKIWRGCVYYSFWLYQKGVITRAPKFYKAYKKKKGIVGHQVSINYDFNCQYVFAEPTLLAINECTLLKVDERGRIVINDDTSPSTPAKPNLPLVNGGDRL